MFFKVTERAIYGKIAGTELSEGKKVLSFLGNQILYLFLLFYIYYF